MHEVSVRTFEMSELRWHAADGLVVAVRRLVRGLVVHIQLQTFSPFQSIEPSRIIVDRVSLDKLLSIQDKKLITEMR